MLTTLSINTLATVFNDAVAAHSLPLKPVAKFSDKAKAMVRVQRVMDEHSLDLVLSPVPALVKRAPQPGDEAIREEMRQEMIEEIGAEKVAEAEGTAPSTNPVETNVAKTETPKADKPSKAPKAAKPTPEPKAPRAGVSRDPKAAKDILAARAGTNQALLIDVLMSGTTIEAAARHVNGSLGKDLKDSVIYSTILYDLCTVKGYGIRVERMNGEALYKADLFVDANELHFNDRGAGDKYDAAVTRLVYFLVLPAGMSEPVPHTARKTLTAEEKAAKPKRERKAKTDAAPETKTEEGAAPVDPAKTEEQVAADAQKAADAAEFDGDKPAE